MATKTDICNLALGELGVERISQFGESSVNGRACSSCFDHILNQELEDHCWAFAIARKQISASATVPTFGRAYLYDWPVEAVKILGPYPEYNHNSLDWLTENRQIVTNFSSPLDLRYVANDKPTSAYSPLFVKVLSLALAIHMCQELTQNSAMKAELISDKRDAISRAKKSNAIQKVAVRAPDPSWITARN